MKFSLILIHFCVKMNHVHFVHQLLIYFVEIFIVFDHIVNNVGWINMVQNHLLIINQQLDDNNHWLMFKPQGIWKPIYFFSRLFFILFSIQYSLIHFRTQDLIFFFFICLKNNCEKWMSCFFYLYVCVCDIFVYINCTFIDRTTVYGTVDWYRLS